MVFVEAHSIKPVFYTMLSSNLRYTQHLSISMPVFKLHGMASPIIFTTRDGIPICSVGC